jgi:hypothetical protein
MSGGRVSKVILSVVAMTLMFAFSVMSAGASTQSITGTATTTGGNGTTTLDSTYSSPGLLGSGTIHTDFTITFAPPGVVTNGTFVLTRTDGATLTGPGTGTVDLSSFPYPVVIHSIVTAGTGGLTGVTGEIIFTGTTRGPGNLGEVFAMTGTLTTPTPAPTDKAQCKRGGWRTVVDDHGVPFRNQGQCVSFVEHSTAKHHNRVSLADLAGSFTGTQSFTFNTNGCAFVHQVFDASYPGTATVGTVTLHIEGCVSSPITSYTGTFTISISVGTLSGTASGPLTLNPSVYTYDLTLTATAGTDAFASATGTLHSLINWPAPFGPSITGTVTVP